MQKTNSTSLLSRRHLLKLLGVSAGVGASGALLAACGASPTAAPTAPPAATAIPAATQAPAESAATEAPAASPATDATAVPEATAGATPSSATLPADAAEAAQQVFVLTGNTGMTYMDGSYSIYKSSPGANMYSLPPVRFNHDFEILPAAAKTWRVDDAGTTWTFDLRDDVKWTDGKALNADDFITTFEYYTDPKSAYDFNWYFSETKLVNFNEVTAGEKPASELGIRKGASDFELIMETTAPVPYLPLMLTYFMALHATAIKAADGWNVGYNTDPATAVSAGPFILKEVSPTRVVADANPNMPDDLKPIIQKMIAIPLDVAQRLQAYQAGQLDHMEVIQTADIEAVQADETLSKEVQPDVGDFRCDYFFFDVTTAPFDNLKFRQALSHLLDRDYIVENITKPLASTAAYSFLAPGFPGHNPELKSIQDYSIDKAKAAFTESGLDPAAIGKLTIQVRADAGETRKAAAELYAASIKDNLGVEVDVQMVEQKVFMDDLNAKPTKVAFGFVSYGMDYLDQSNMLSVFKTGGRHNWNNAEYQKLLDEAGPMTDTAKRNETYAAAETLLVTEVPAVFAIFRTQPKLLKPYVSGASLQPGKSNTIYGLSWPGFSILAVHPWQVYINNTVTELRPEPPV